MLHDLPFPVPLPSLSPLTRQSSPSYRLFGFFYRVCWASSSSKKINPRAAIARFLQKPSTSAILFADKEHTIDQSQPRIFLISRNLQHWNLLRDKLRAKVVIRELIGNNAFQLATQQCCANWILQKWLSAQSWITMAMLNNLYWTENLYRRLFDFKSNYNLCQINFLLSPWVSNTSGVEII